MLKKVLLALLALTASACDHGKWGANCENFCGNWAANSQCNESTGVCELNCANGWSGLKCDNPSCEEATCEAVGGHCVAPNVCACPSSETSIVAQYKTNKNGETEVWCDNLRISGLRGAAVGLVVLTSSITLCGIIERQMNKGKVMGTARFHQDE
jgi:hypothetical protein